MTDFYTRYVWVDDSVKLGRVKCAVIHLHCKNYRHEYPLMYTTVPYKKFLAFDEGTKRGFYNLLLDRERITRPDAELDQPNPTE